MRRRSATGGVAGGTYLFALPARLAPAATTGKTFSNRSSTAASAPANLVELMPRLQEHLTAGG
jgi:molybdenum cofactor biosynthesis protein B